MDKVLELVMILLGVDILGIVYILESRREQSIIIAIMERRILGIFFKRPALRKIALGFGISIIVISTAFLFAFLAGVEL